jgi:hypothetical protein
MRWGFVPLFAALFLLTGCHELWGGSAGSDYAATTVTGGTATAEVDPTADDLKARSNVRRAVVPIEAWYADHQTYAGLSVEKLQRIDPLLRGVSLVGPLTRDWYCVESSVGNATWSKQGPAAPISGGHCPDAVVVPPPPSSDPLASLRAVIPAIEAWGIEHGTYAGATVATLRAEYDSTIPRRVELVNVTKKSYCVESTARGETWSYTGPRPGFRKGGC